MNVLINVIKLIIDSNNASVQLTKKKSHLKDARKTIFWQLCKTRLTINTYKNKSSLHPQ